MRVFVFLPLHGPGDACAYKTGRVVTNVLLIRVHVTIVAVEKQSVLHILSACL